MTKLMEQAIAAIRRLPDRRQDELAEALILASAEAPVEGYSAEQLAAIDEGLADADAGRFASDEEVAQRFARYRAA